MHATTECGARSRTRRAIMSMSPRTALTGVPSDAVTDSGTPKNARKYSDGVSSSMSPPTPPSSQLRAVARPGSDDLDGHDAGVVVGVGGAERRQHPVQDGL